MSRLALLQMSSNSSITQEQDDIDFLQAVVIYSSRFLTVLASVAFIVNLYLLSCSRYLRRPIGVNLRLCVSLTASDALCAFFYILSFVINVLIPQGIVSTCWSLLIEVCKYSSFFASVFTLLTLALNHYIGIVYPLKRHAITLKTVRCAILLAYLAPFLFFLILFCLHPGGFRAKDSFSFFSPSGCSAASIFLSPAFRWVVVLPFILVLLLLSFLYGHILVHMGRIQKDPLLHSNVNSSTKRTSNRKLLVTLVLLAGSACLGWLPTMVSYLVTCNSCLFPLGLRSRTVLAVFSQTIHISKLILDAFIYSSRLIEIRYSMFVLGEKIKNRIRRVTGRPMGSPPLPSEFTRYLSETKEGRSTRRKNTELLPRKQTSPVPCSKRASSVVMVGTNGKVAEGPTPVHKLLSGSRKSSEANIRKNSSPNRLLL